MQNNISRTGSDAARLSTFSLLCTWYGFRRRTSFDDWQFYK